MTEDNKNAVNTVSPAGIELDQKTLAKIKVPRKFEIFVEEFDEEGGPGHTPAWRAVKVDPSLGGTGGNPIITVTSPADMIEKQNFYKQVGQRFKIVREIDPPSKERLIQLAVEQGLIDQSAVNQTPVSNNPPEQTVQPPAAVNRDEHVAYQVPSVSQCAVQAVQPVVEQKIQQKPKIVTVGDTQIKYDGDKVYQRQWIKLTSTEAANFRIVNDSNNKLVPMAGKHIEAKKWVMIEEDENAGDFSMENDDL